MEDISNYAEYEQTLAAEELGVDFVFDNDHKYCICNELLNRCKDAYVHMSSGV